MPNDSTHSDKKGGITIITKSPDGKSDIVIRRNIRKGGKTTTTTTGPDGKTTTTTTKDKKPKKDKGSK